jgi:hypothetical protein
MSVPNPTKTGILKRWHPFENVRLSQEFFLKLGLYKIFGGFFSQKLDMGMANRMQVALKNFTFF